MGFEASDMGYVVRVHKKGHGSKKDKQPEEQQERVQFVMDFDMAAWEIMKKVRRFKPQETTP